MYSAPMDMLSTKIVYITKSREKKEIYNWQFMKFHI